MKTVFLLVALCLAGGLAAPAFVVRSQLCGYSFAKFAVADSTGKNVSDATIELVARLSIEGYQNFRIKKGIEGSGSGSNFKLSLKDSDELLKLAGPLRSSTDHCGNPLKQRNNFTRVKTVEDFVRGR